jgi:hypothetical protein
VEWSFRVFLDFLECVIMRKRGRSEKYFISCAVSGSKIF